MKELEFKDLLIETVCESGECDPESAKNLTDILAGGTVLASYLLDKVCKTMDVKVSDEMQKLMDARPELKASALDFLGIVGAVMDPSRDPSYDTYYTPTIFLYPGSIEHFRGNIFHVYGITMSHPAIVIIKKFKNLDYEDLPEQFEPIGNDFYLIKMSILDSYSQTAILSFIYNRIMDLIDEKIKRR